MKNTKQMVRRFFSCAVASVALSVSPLFAQTNLGASCGCPSVAARTTTVKLSTLGTSIQDTDFVYLFGTNGSMLTSTGTDGHQHPSVDWSNTNIMTSYVLKGNTTLTCDKVWELDHKFYVPSGLTLTVKPGTLIRGDASPSPDEATALIVERGGKIIADGTPTCGIVMTCTNDNLDGKYPISRVGDWGGFVLLGKGWVNLNLIDDTSTPTSTRYCAGTDGYGFIEGFTSTNPHNIYGGGTTPDFYDNSGIVRYVSVRHSGAVLPIVAGTNQDGSNELNGISMGAVGAGTTFEYNDVIGAADDNIEYFGGSVNIKHTLTMFGADDMFDFDLGYRGKAQFYIGLAMAPNDTLTNNTNIQTQDNGIEADADDDGAHEIGTYTCVDGSTFPKVSHPVFYNCTFVHNGRRLAHADNTGPAGIQGKELTQLECYNSIFANFRSGLHLATARSITGSAVATTTNSAGFTAKAGGDAYDNWVNGSGRSTPFQSSDADYTDGNWDLGKYGKAGSLIVKNNVFIGCEYPLTVGVMASGKWDIAPASGGVTTNIPGYGPQAYYTASTAGGSIQWTTNSSPKLWSPRDGQEPTIAGVAMSGDWNQFTVTDNNKVMASCPGFVFNWATVSSKQDVSAYLSDITAAGKVASIKYDICPTPQLTTPSQAPNDGFFTPVGYVGAIDQDSPNWMSQWAYAAVLQITAGLQNNPTDINNDGVTDVNDFNLLVGKYGQTNK